MIALMTHTITTRMYKLEARLKYLIGKHSTEVPATSTKEPITNTVHDTTMIGGQLKTSATAMMKAEQTSAITEIMTHNSPESPAPPEQPVPEQQLASQQTAASPGYVTPPIREE